MVKNGWNSSLVFCLGTSCSKSVSVGWFRNLTTHHNFVSSQLHSWPLVPSWNSSFARLPGHHFLLAFLSPWWPLPYPPSLLSLSNLACTDIGSETLYPSKLSPGALNSPMALKCNCYLSPETFVLLAPSSALASVAYPVANLMFPAGLSVVHSNSAYWKQTSWFPFISFPAPPSACFSLSKHVELSPVCYEPGFPYCPYLPGALVFLGGGGRLITFALGSLLCLVHGSGSRL